MSGFSHTHQIRSRAPEHSFPIELSLGQVVTPCASVVRGMVEDGSHRLFEAPLANEVVRLGAKARDYGLLSQNGAADVIRSWMRQVSAQSKADNSGKVILSLFDMSGQWSDPWAEAGYQVYRFDIQDDPELGDVSKFDVEFFKEFFGDFEGAEVYVSTPTKK